MSRSRLQVSGSRVPKLHNQIMNTDELTIKQAREIAAMFPHLHATAPTGPSSSPPNASNIGQNIVVLDRGFVYVGNVIIEGDMIRVTSCKNLRVWGTTKGLGELVNGPLSGTKLDDVGVILAPMKSLIHFIPCKGF